LELTILQKELIILYANDKDTKENWLKEINKTIEFSSNGIPDFILFKNNRLLILIEFFFNFSPSIANYT
jgi:hypothetical protein